MENSITILSQLLSFLSKKSFNRLVGQHSADKYVKKLTAWNQFVLLLYAQASSKDSLREIETGINIHQNSFYHLGIKSAARSSLSYANNNRDSFTFSLNSLRESSPLISLNSTIRSTSLTQQPLPWL